MAFDAPQLVHDAFWSLLEQRAQPGLHLILLQLLAISVVVHAAKEGGLVIRLVRWQPLGDRRHHSRRPAIKSTKQLGPNVRMGAVAEPAPFWWREGRVVVPRLGSLLLVEVLLV